MSETRAAAFPAQPHPRVKAKTAQWPLNLTRSEMIVDGLWVVFFIGTTTALNRLAEQFGVVAVERLFWFPAYLAVAVQFLPYQRQFMLFARKNLIFMTWPAVACLSALWSFTPFVSFYHGIQLFMTIAIGFVLFAHAGLVRQLQIMFSALLFCSLLSVLLVVAQPAQSISVTGEWLGSFTHKNQLGNLMAFQIITGLCLLRHGWRPLLCATGTALAAALMILSRSATALVALTIALAAIPPAIAFRSGRTAFFIVLVAVVWMAGLIALVINELQIDVIQSILAGLGKDATLSSRTILWDFAIDAFQERPWLGFGFKGYWLSWETSAPMLRYEIGQALWFFHNVFLETAVAFGVVGPVLFVAGLLVALRNSLRLVGVSRGFIWFWPLLFTVFTIVQCFGEYPLFVNHSLSQTLLPVASAMLWRPVIMKQRVPASRPNEGRLAAEGRNAI